MTEIVNKIIIVASSWLSILLYLKVSEYFSNEAMAFDLLDFSSFPLLFSGSSVRGRFVSLMSFSSVFVIIVHKKMEDIHKRILALQFK